MQGTAGKNGFCETLSEKDSSQDRAWASEGRKCWHGLAQPQTPDPVLQGKQGAEVLGDGSPTLFLNPPLTKREKSREQSKGTLM